MLIFLHGNSAFIYNVCNGERTITKFLNLCPILLIYVNKICSIQFTIYLPLMCSNQQLIGRLTAESISVPVFVVNLKCAMQSINSRARIYRLHLLENFRPTVANKSELEVCLYFFPIDKHVQYFFHMEFFRRATVLQLNTSNK